MYRQQSRQQNRQPVKTYEIHPTSVKLITKGHPWVTLDQYSEKFHPKDKFIVAADKQKPFALLLHDPTHSSVKARVWSTGGNFQNQIKSFKNDLITRIRKAIKKRADAKFSDERNHYYLVFSEADNIPGVLVHYLNGEILVQFYMKFWDPYREFFIQNLTKAINEIYKLDIDSEVDYENIWIQERSLVKDPAKCSDANVRFRNFEVEEFGVKYLVTLGKYYDHGIYTDMSSIRGRLAEELAGCKNLLNLYSYTGAFSLYALKHGLEHVHSVDLSAAYLEWLEKNLAINPDIDPTKHTSLECSTKDALTNFINDKKCFDFIICDPPSSSSDGNKVTNALAEYKDLLELINEALSPTGKALVFINTHKVSMKKFEDKIRQHIQGKKLPLKIKNKYYLSQDCPFKKGFPEGNYLKGLLLEKHDPGK